MMSYKFGTILILLCLTHSLTKRVAKGLITEIASQCTEYLDYYDVHNIKCSSVEEIGNFKFPTNSDVEFQGTQPSQVVNASIFQHTNINKLLFKNCLRKLNPGDFQHLNSEALYSIKFIDNVLNELMPGVFNHLLIHDLYLNKNQIKFIYPGVFSNMSNLHYLKLKGNEISTIVVGIFNNLPIMTLALNNNQIHYIGQGAFHNLTKLWQLELRNNRLSVFNGQELFNYQTSITHLDLSSNLLPKISTEMFRGFQSLASLYIRDNLISTIDPSSFNETPHLFDLDLRSNKLKEINADIFPAGGLQDLRYVELQNNELSFLSLNFLYALIRLKRLVLGGNPWQCGCLKIILRWMEENGKRIDSCDRHYFKGMRPVCMVLQRHSDACVYKIFEDNIKNYVDVRNLFKPHHAIPNRCY